MSDNSYVDVFSRLLIGTYRKRVITGDDTFLWCPIRSGDFTGLSEFGEPGVDGRCFRDIIKYIYAPGSLLDKNFQLSDIQYWAEILLKFPDNQWLKEDFEIQVKGMLKDSDTFTDSTNNVDIDKFDAYCRKLETQNQKDRILNAWEIQFLATYKMGHETNDELLINMAKIGRLKTNPSHDSSYIYFRSVKISERELRTNKKFVVKSSTDKTFFWLDVGAWSSPQKPNDLNGNAPIGIITPHEVALYNIYGNKAEISKCRRPTPGSLGADVLGSLSGVFGGGATFYKDLRAIPDMGPAIPLMEHGLIFVIPDLHLHLFREKSVDNFIEPWQDGKSLETLLQSVLAVARNFNDKKGIPVSIVQIGDLYDLWESAWYLLLALNAQDGSSSWLKHVFNVQDPRPSFPRELAFRVLDLLGSDYRKRWNAYEKDVEKYFSTLHDIAVNRQYDTTFPQNELRELAKNPWKDKSLEEIWKKMQKEIEKQYPLLFSTVEKNGEEGIFAKDWFTKRVKGNHDSYLGNKDFVELGLNNSIRLEHLDYDDPFNKPQTEAVGIFITLLNMFFETRLSGDQAKALETSRRDSFIRAVAQRNFIKYSKEESMYDLIVTGHTHRAYAGAITMKQSKSEFNYECSCKYDQGWQKEWSSGQDRELLRLAVTHGNPLGGVISNVRWNIRWSDLLGLLPKGWL
jgi:hypothetical protein